MVMKGRTLKVTIVGDSKSLQRAFKKAKVSASGLAGGLGKLALGAGVALAGIGIASIKSAANFESSFSKIVGLVGISQQKVDGFKDSVLALAGETARAPQELADALFFITSAGLRGQDALDALEVSAKAAAAGLGETKDVAFAAVSAMNAYGAENLSAADAVDILTNTVRQGNVEAAEVASVLGNIIPLAAEMGISFDQVGAAMAAMTRLGADAASSATSIGQIMATVLKPATVDTALALEEVGLTMSDLRKEIREEGLLSVLTTLKDKFGDNEEAMARVFGNVRALRGVLNLVGQNAETTAEIFGELANSTGLTEEAFGVAADTAAFQFGAAMAEVQVVLIDIGDRLLPIVLSAMEALLPVIMEELVPALADMIEALAAMAQQWLPAVIKGISLLSDVMVGWTLIGQSFAGVFSEADRMAQRLTINTISLKKALADGAQPAAALANGLLDLAQNEALTTGAMEKLTRASGVNTEEQGHALTAILESTHAQELSEVQIVRLNNALKGTQRELGLIPPLGEGVIDVWLESARAADELEAETIEAAAALEAAAEPTEDLAVETFVLADALQTAMDAQEGLSDTLRKIADPVFNAVSALMNYNEVVKSVGEDGKTTAAEQLELSAAAFKVGDAFDSLNPENSVNAMDAISASLGVTREATAGYLEELGIFQKQSGELSSGISEGILSGMDGLAGRLRKRLSKEIGGALTQTMMDYGIRSPSKVFRDEIGRPIGEGIGEGIEAEGANLERALTSTLNRLRNVEVPAVGALPSGGASASGIGTGAGGVLSDETIDKLAIAMARELASVLGGIAAQPITIEVTTNADPEEIADALGFALRME